MRVRYACESEYPLLQIVHRSFALLLEHADQPHITFYDFGHTCASLLFSKNVQPKLVRELLGRASVAFTLDPHACDGKALMREAPGN